jgi:hypothetical protein
MIMSLIIILPLISADTWFNNDPTIDQMMGNYFKIAETLTQDSVHDYLSLIVNSSFSMTSPIIYMTAQIGNRTYTYPDDFPLLSQPEFPLSDYM